MGKSVLEVIISITAKHLGVSVSEVKSSSNLEDLGLNSLDLVVLIIEIEEHFDISISDTIFDTSETVEDFEKCVLSIINK
ncbi:MAG: acyl carrier protein [Flavobacteriaceae bacterium]